MSCYSFELNILCLTVEPPQINHSFNEETMMPGPSVFLKCIASGNPTPEISWELDAKKLSNTDRQVLMSVNLLPF